MNNYVPGSTFKTVMMYTAFRNGMQDIRFSTGGGPFHGKKKAVAETITDDNGSCEACGNIGIDVAYQNQQYLFFLHSEHTRGREDSRPCETAGLGAYDSISGEGQGQTRT